MSITRIDTRMVTREVEVYVADCAQCHMAADCPSRDSLPRGWFWVAEVEGDGAARYTVVCSRLCLAGWASRSPTNTVSLRSGWCA